MGNKQTRQSEDPAPSKRPIDGRLDRALKEAMSAIEKHFGKGAIMTMDTNAIPDIAVISTGSLGLDISLGVGGLPRGRVCEIFGPESSGKTTLALSAIAQAQAAGLRCAFIDAEHALDLRYAANLGIKVEELLVSQPDSGEQALEIVEILANSGAVALIVVDSVAALVPRAEIEGNMGDTHVGLQARLMSQAMRKLTSVTAKHAATVFFINQIRMKVGVMFGSPETTPGGNALRFYSSVRLDVRRISQIKSPDGTVGYRTRVKVVKNKVAPPFRQAEFDLIFGKGINRLGELADWASDLNLMDHSGSWYSWRDRKLGQGRNNVCQILGSDPGLARAIEEAIRKKLRGEQDPASDNQLVA